MSKPTKRKRTGDSGATVPVKKLKVQAAVKRVAEKNPVDANALKWRETALPDRLEDAEGFFGLEEIDDVDVIRDSQTGQILFQPSQAGDAAVDQDEWSGFGDEQDPLVQNSASVATQPAKAKSSTSDNAGKSTKAKKSQKKSDVIDRDDPTIDEDVGFSVLDDVDETTTADVTAWKELNLSQEILSAISKLGFSDPTPIQKLAILPIIEGCDVIGKAVTGSGKTLAFGIPIIEKWLEARTTETHNKSTVPIAFILAPTRELAHQLTKHLTALCQSLEHAPRIATVTGGLSVIKQQRLLENADIIIGTPGRLWEVINSSQGLLDRLKQIRFLVVDEADRLLSEGHYKEVEEILDVLNRKVINEDDDEGDVNELQELHQRQTLVFSATFQKDLQQRLTSKQKWRPNSDSNLLSNSQSLEYLLKKLKFQPGVKPTYIDANPTSQMSQNLSESILECSAMQKDLYLYSLLLLHQHEHSKHLRTKQSLPQQEKMTRTLVFTNSISTVKRLTPLLNTLAIPQTTILPLHSSMPQKSRLRSLERFQAPPDKGATTSILIATDVAARGLDIKGVDTIVHYHVPRTADTYVHRSGRTARGQSSSGRSILLCSPEEVISVTRLISKVHTDKTESSDNDEDEDDDGPNQKNAKIKTQTKHKKKKSIHPFTLPANLPTQLQNRISLAQKITNANLDTSKLNSDSHFLRTAAEELGVDYSSSDFDDTSIKHRRGRGGGKAQKRKENVKNKELGKVEVWKAELRAELNSGSGSGSGSGFGSGKKGKGSRTKKRIDFGDGEGINGKFLAGGATDVERLLSLGL